jgi:hypothetical protein
MSRPETRLLIQMVTGQGMFMGSTYGFLYFFVGWKEEERRSDEESWFDFHGKIHSGF